LQSKKYNKSLTDFLKKEKSEVFFVRGFQRSGTNWVCNILNLHPKINCVGEFHFSNFAKVYNNSINNRFGLFANNNQIITKHFETFVSNSIKEYAGNFPLCGDRTPEPLNAVLLPNHKYILITRDGRDCIVSWMYHCLRRETMKNNKNFDKLLEKFKKDDQYFEENKQELLSMKGFLRKLSKNWNDRIINDLKVKANAEKHGIEVFHIEYEKLLLNTQEITNKLYTFLGVKPKEAKKLDDLTSPGFKKNNPNSHYRKGESGRWKLYFTEEQHQIFKNNAKKACELLGLNKQSIT